MKKLVLLLIFSITALLLVPGSQALWQEGLWVEGNVKTGEWIVEEAITPLIIPGASTDVDEASERSEPQDEAGQEEGEQIVDSKKTGQESEEQEDPSAAGSEAEGDVPEDKNSLTGTNGEEGTADNGEQGGSSEDGDDGGDDGSDDFSGNDDISGSDDSSGNDDTSGSSSDED